MQGSNPARKLTTILSADAAEYSRLMHQDEEGTARTLRQCRQAIESAVLDHQGRIFGTAGDSVIAEFASPVEALRAAIDIHQAIAAIDSGLPESQRMLFRIGINLGDVLVEGSDLIGDGVNIAERIRGLGQPGEICVSSGVHEITNVQSGLVFEDMGRFSVKNIDQPIHVYRVRLPAGDTVPTTAKARGRRRGRAIGLAAALMLALGLAFWFGYTRYASDNAGPEVAAENAKRAFIAVLPFENLSGDSAQDYFVDGITDDVTAALGRFSGLSVMSREAMKQYKGTSVAPGELTGKFGVRYLLRGSVRRSGDRVRVSADLGDAASGQSLWSDTYDAELKDVFAVQDDITQNVTGALAITLSKLERQRSLAKPPDNLQAYDYLQRGIDLVHRNTRADNLAARKMLEMAIELDPNYAAAYVALGVARLRSAFSGWTERVAESLEAARQNAEKALAIDSDNAEAHALLGGVHLNLGDTDQALVEIRKAIALNPNDSESYAVLGAIETYGGQPDEGIKAFEIAMRLNPEMNAGRFSPVGWAYYLAGRYNDAIRVQNAALRLTPNDFFVHAGLAASYAMLGRREEAAKAARDTVRNWPFFDASNFAEQFTGSLNQALIVEGLRKAGLQ